MTSSKNPKLKVHSLMHVILSQVSPSNGEALIQYLLQYILPFVIAGKFIDDVYVI